MARLNSFEELDNLRALLKEETFKPETPRVRACCGTACLATGAEKAIAALE